MALNDFEHPECKCIRESPPAVDCKLHGVGTTSWGIASATADQGHTVRVGSEPSISLPITIHTDKLAVQQKRDLDDCRELLIEARNHARLTQNLGLMRRIDYKLQDLGVI